MIFLTSSVGKPHRRASDRCSLQSGNAGGSLGQVDLCCAILNAFSVSRASFPYAMDHGRYGLIQGGHNADAANGVMTVLARFRLYETKTSSRGTAPGTHQSCQAASMFLLERCLVPGEPEWSRNLKGEARRQMLPTRAMEVTRVGRSQSRAHCNYSAAIPLKPTAAVNAGISSTSLSVPFGSMAKTPTVPTIALSV